MRNLFERKLAVALIGATIVIAILIGIFGALAASDRANIAENALGTATEPGQVAVTESGGFIKGIFEYFGNIKKLRAENEELKRRNVELDKQVRDALGLEKENWQLRQMLDIQETESALDLVAAQIIAKDPSNWFSSFKINKGTNDGIEKNQLVLTANRELVGQVYKVGSTWAEVITILDPDSGVGSMIERSKEIGVVEGDFSLRYKGLCRLGYMGKDADVEAGDYVETSGMGGIYPRGLLIGKAIEIHDDNITMSKYALIEPVVDMSRLMEVFVLKNHVEEIKREPMGVIDEEEEKEDEDDEDKEAPARTSAPKPTTKPSAAPTQKPTQKPTQTAAPTQKPGSTHSQAVNGSELRE